MSALAEPKTGWGHCVYIYDPCTTLSYAGSVLSTTGGSVHHGDKEAKAAVFDDIEVFYNRQRLHSLSATEPPPRHGRAWRGPPDSLRNALIPPLHPQEGSLILRSLSKGRPSEAEQRLRPINTATGRPAMRIHRRGLLKLS